MALALQNQNLLAAAALQRNPSQLATLGTQYAMQQPNIQQYLQPQLSVQQQQQYLPVQQQQFNPPPFLQQQGYSQLATNHLIRQGAQYQLVGKSTILYKLVIGYILIGCLITCILLFIAKMKTVGRTTFTVTGGGGSLLSSLLLYCRSSRSYWSTKLDYFLSANRYGEGTQ
jgi:hypothetical protein